MAQRRLRREDYTVGWVCALPIELAAAAELLDEEHQDPPQDPSDTNIYTLGRIGEHNVVVACLPAGQTGNNSAATVAAQMKLKFTSIQFNLMVGIGGGVPSNEADIRLGDVVVSQPYKDHCGVVQYDFGKTTPNRFERTGFLNAPPAILLNALSKLRSNHFRGRSNISAYLSQLNCLPKFARHNAGPDKLYEPSYNHAGGLTCERCSKDRLVERTSRGSQEIVVHYGTIASGNQVMRDGITRDRLSLQLGGILCFEMEAAGLMNSFPCLVIRGICDYADSHKNKDWQPYAAATAAAFAKEILSVIPRAEVAIACTVAEAIKDKDDQMICRLPISTLPFERDVNFVGREDIISEIDRRLALRRRVAIAGIGGVGKSQIAIEYCYRFQAKKSRSSILWVHAGTPARFQEAYTAIGKKLSLPGLDNPESDILQVVHDWLSDERHGAWLMVLDNVDDMETFFATTPELSSVTSKPMSPLAAYIPRSPNGYILITTRDTRAGERLSDREKCIMIPPLARQDAEHLLRSKVSSNHDWSESDAARLAKTLEYLPLAITQAAAFICENHCTTTSYLEALQAGDSDQIEMLNEDFLDPRRDIGRPSSVMRTWKVSFDLIRNRKPRAAEMFSLAAVFDRQGIPKFLLRRDSDREIDFITALGTLQSFSLIEAEKGGKTFVMHRLVQICMKSWLKVENLRQQYEKEAVEVLSKNFPNSEHKNWKTCELLLPHARKVLGYMYSSRATQLHYATLCQNVSCYDISQGRYGSAFEVAKVGLELRQQFLGELDPTTLRSLSDLALVRGDQGKYEEAEAMNRRAIDGREKVLGKEHPDTLTTVSNLAAVLRYQGKYEEAEAMNRRVLNGSEKVLGEEHPDTLTSVNNLALVLQYQGKYEEAEAMNRRALDGREKVLGKEHPGTLASVNNLALVLQYQGKCKEAEAMNRRALDGREKVLGKEHPGTLTSVNNLADVLQYQGKYEEAEAMNRRALDGMEKALGKEHPHTLASVNNLASVLQYQGKYEEAEAMNRRALDGSEKVLGKEHPDTLTTVSNLAVVLQYQGKYEEAEVMNRRALDGSEKVLGKEHPDTLTSVYCLAYLLHQQKRYKAASILYQRASGGYRTILGLNHPKTIACENHYSIMLQKMEYEAGVH